MRPTLTPIQRWAAKVRLPAVAGECWEWAGSRHSAGYGQLTIDGKKRLAHQLAYEWFVGPVPTGLELDHFACDNRWCCNPDHVRPVTRRENMLRGQTVAAAHAAKTHCPQGHAYTPDNLTQSGLVRGQRRCRTCANRGRR